MRQQSKTPEEDNDVSGFRVGGVEKIICMAWAKHVVDQMAVVEEETPKPPTMIVVIVLS